MSILHDAYTALLSGLTYKTGNEIHWQDKNGYPITIEPIDIKQCKYIIREYWNNGQKYSEKEFQNKQLHGKYFLWYYNGQKAWELKYQNGRRHGKIIGWWENGLKMQEEEWKDGLLYGKSISWNIDGQKCSELEHRNGMLTKRIL